MYLSLSGKSLAPKALLKKKGKAERDWIFSNAIIARFG